MEDGYRVWVSQDAYRDDDAKRSCHAGKCTCGAAMNWYKRAKIEDLRGFSCCSFFGLF